MLEFIILTQLNMVLELNEITKIMNKIIKGILLSFYTIFVIALIAGGLSAGIMTVIPDTASKPCYLGYYAHCSFAPFSTLILLAMAILGSYMFIKLIKYIKREIKKVKVPSLTKPISLSII
jgi:uncharacterized membrane protein YedE/YeeE